VLVLKQILNLIPRGMINRLALETGVEAKSRSFSVVSYLSALLFAQLCHAMGINDVCDWLRLKSAALIRFGVTPPSRNGLSNANKERGVRGKTVLVGAGSSPARQSGLRKGHENIVKDQNIALQGRHKGMTLRRCWSMCCSGSWHISQPGGTASRGSLPSRTRHCGRGVIYWHC
jgi:hypothetical protein